VTKSRENRRNAGKPCTYCQRTMILNHIHLKPTRDHHMPKARGGWNSPIIPACGQCNEIKGDMLPEQWQRFMAAFPEWWRMRPIEINRAKRAEFPHLKSWNTEQPNNPNFRKRRPPVVVPPELIYPAATARAAEPQPAEQPV
jgi:hypothetical protein